VNYHILHERNYNQNNSDAMENLIYMKNKYKKRFMVNFILNLFYIKVKIFGLRKHSKDG
jgi:hypothetical protein